MLRPTGALLRADAADSLRAWALVSGKQLWPVWEGLAYSVRTGKSYREVLTGMHGYGRFERDRDAAATFNEAMVDITRHVARAFTAQYELAGKVVDVGGGYGQLLMAVLRRHAGTRSILFDLPHAIEGAGERWKASGLSGRFTLLTAYCLESVPHGGGPSTCSRACCTTGTIQAVR